MKTHYRRNLPHMHPINAYLFITFRLANSIPRHKISEWKREQRIAEKALCQQYSEPDQKEILKTALHQLRKRYFVSFDQYLDQAFHGPTWLKIPEIATIVQQAIHHHHPRSYDLLAYCIMPNHVHLLVWNKQRIDNQAFYHVLRSLKSYSSRTSNLRLNRVGQTFWQQESYDHVVRNQKELHNIVRYIINNPVKARLVDDWMNWKHHYINTEIVRDVPF